MPKRFSSQKCCIRVQDPQLLLIQWWFTLRKSTFTVFFLNFFSISLYCIIWNCNFFCQNVALWMTDWYLVFLCSSGSGLPHFVHLQGRGAGWRASWGKRPRESAQLCNEAGKRWAVESVGTTPNSPPPCSITLCYWPVGHSSLSYSSQTSLFLSLSLSTLVLFTKELLTDCSSLISLVFKDKMIQYSVFGWECMFSYCCWPSFWLVLQVKWYVLQPLRGTAQPIRARIPHTRVYQRNDHGRWMSQFLPVKNDLFLMPFDFFKS